MTTEDGVAGNGYGQPSPADVRLMATAPELLRAAKHLVHLTQQFSESGDYVPAHMAIADDAIAAIAKAEGRE